MIYAQSLPLATGHRQIRRSALGDRSCVVGVAAMVLDERFSLERVLRWIGSGTSAGRPALVSP